MPEPIAPPVDPAAPPVDPPKADAPPADPPADDPEGADKLGDAGKQALDRMKTQRNTARDEAREFKALGLSPAEIKAILDKQAGNGDGDKIDADAIKREATKEATTKANGRIIRSEVRAAAAGKLADPSDAHSFLDLTKFEVDDDGNVDEDEIAEAIDDLIKKKPYLAAQGKRFQGDADGGTRKEARPSQLSKSDLDALSPEEIVKARKEGRCDDLLGIKR